MRFPRAFTLLAYCLAVLSAFCATARADVRINEILATNDGGLKDEDGEDSGWIELFNDGASAQSLAGWRLTDTSLLPNKWVFPSVTIPSGGYLVVFASGKNRATAGQTLHTNFRLDPDGEYLALSRADGSIASEYAPTFPKQRRNISYARVSDPVVIPLANSASASRYLVPKDGALGNTWTVNSFDDSSWAGSSAAIGYDTLGGSGAASLSVDFNDRENNTPALTQAGFDAFIIGSTGSITATQTGPIARTFGAVTLTLSETGGVTYDDRRRTTPTNSGSFTEQLLLQDLVFARDQTGTNGLTITAAGLPANLPVTVRIWSFDSSSSGARVSDWFCNGQLVKENYTFNGATLPLTNEQYRFDFTATTTATGQLAIEGKRDLTSSTFGVFLNALQIIPLSYAQSISTNIEAAMRTVNSSVYLRTTFTVPDPQTIKALRFRVKYDEGFAAYVNGQLVASRNVPASLTWNSAATADRVRSDALSAEEITVQLPAGVLVAGANMLAIQGVNLSASDPDFLLNVQMDGVGETAPAPRFFATPTPGAVNATGYDGFVADTSFTIDRGLYTAPTSVAISCSTPSAQIRYTLDGSAPTETTGIVYSGPIAVNATTILRAAAFRPNWIPSNIDTQSYLFPATVAVQSAAPPGWPSTWGTDSEVNSNDGAGTGTVVSDYEMDLNVLNNTQPGFGLADALTALPTLSVALPLSDFLGPNGIYQNPLATDTANADPRLWERACSMELFEADGTVIARENCGLEIHGNSSRRPYRLQKHSFDLKFKARYGAGKLNANLFETSPVTKFNSLVLRGCFTDAWALVSWDPARYRPDDSVYFRDVWMKQSFREMGWLQTSSRFSHLYINGLYWGVYDISEDLNEDFFTSHLGGLPTDWDIMGDFAEVKAGTATGWDSLFALVNAGLSTPQAYATLQQQLDVVNFADYYLLHVHADTEDWPQHNWYAARNRNDAASKWRFYVWDQEIALDNHSIRRLEPTDTNSNIDKTPGRLLQKLRENAEFRLLFADRANKHLNNNGALSLAASQTRWDALRAKLDKAIVAESARWGDVADETPYGNTPSKTVYTREADWIPTVNSVRDAYLPSLYNSALSYATLNELRNAGLYPQTNPPVFQKFGGVVAPGFVLSITASAGAIYYTTDGSDPRQAITGAVAGNSYTGPVTLTTTGTVKARVLNGTEWSALTEALFIVGTPASAGNLVVSEIYYNPPVTQDDEYIELMNVSKTTSIDFSGVHFTAGVAFSFPDGFALDPQQRVLVVKNKTAFEQAFGSGKPVVGEFTGSLENSGDEIALADSSNTEILRFRYDNSQPWPTGAATGGRSLVLLSPASLPDANSPANWRASIAVGGTPGGTDSTPFAGQPNLDADNDGTVAMLEYLTGTSDLTPSNVPVAGGLHTFLFEGATRTFLTATYHRQPSADDVWAGVEFSSDLTNWSPAVFVSRDANGNELWRAPVPQVGEQYLRLRARLP